MPLNPTPSFPASIPDLVTDYAKGQGDPTALDGTALEPSPASAINRTNAELNALVDVVGITGSTDPDSHEHRITALETLLHPDDVLQIVVYPSTSGNVTLPASCTKVRLRGAPGATGTVTLTKAGGSPVVLTLGASPVAFVAASSVVVAVDGTSLSGGAASVVGS